MAETPDTKAILVRVAAGLQRILPVTVASDGMRLAELVGRAVPT